jgi:protein subunit release factor A
MALDILRAKLWDSRQAEVAHTRSSTRKNQVGSGMRGDKRRTIRTQDGVVTDHILNRKWRLKDYLRGNWR